VYVKSNPNDIPSGWDVERGNDDSTMPLRMMPPQLTSPRLSLTILVMSERKSMMSFPPSPLRSPQYNPASAPRALRALTRLMSSQTRRQNVH
jgi:hypothetical protein